MEPALAATLARHGYVHALDVYHPLLDGRRRKLLDHFYLHEAIPGGVDAARKRARASKRLWDDAMARRPLSGLSEETVYRVNCGGVPEAFVASGGNDTALFSPRRACSCSI